MAVGGGPSEFVEGSAIGAGDMTGPCDIQKNARVGAPQRRIRAGTMQRQVGGSDGDWGGGMRLGHGILSEGSQPMFMSR